MSYYGVIDLGSNSIRLVIYQVRDDACEPYSNKDFQDIINEKKITGLSAYVQDGVFTESGITKATEVLTEHLYRAKYFNCVQTRIFATAVLRNCSNSKEAIKTISKNIKHPIELLSAHDEAHLGFVGATCNRTIKRATLIDIGGGSTELSNIVDGIDYRGISIPQGSVSSYARFVNKILPTRKEMHAIEAAFRKRLLALDDVEKYHAQSLYAIGGAPRAALRFYRAAFCENTHPKTLSVERIDKVLTLLADDPHEFAHIAVKAAPDRLHTLVPGSLITITLMRELKASVLEICKYGVREGYLIERILLPNKKSQLTSKRK